MLTVTLDSFGTAMMFFQPKCFISAGTVSFLYLSCSRLFIAFVFLCSLPSRLLAPFYLSNDALQCLQLRVLVPSGRTAWPMRVCLLQLPQTTMTLETWIAASFSTMPPLMFLVGFG